MSNYYEFDGSLYLTPYTEVQQRNCFGSPGCTVDDKKEPGKFEHSEVAYNCYSCLVDNYCPHCEDKLYGYSTKTCPECKKEIKEFKILNHA